MKRFIIAFKDQVQFIVTRQAKIFTVSMPKNILILLILFVAMNAKPNLFIGAGGIGYGCGSNSPAVQRPFSYVRLGPDTTPIMKKMYFEPHHYGGYSTMDHAVRAFSHMHLVGAGVADLGVLGILPKKAGRLTVPKDPSTVFYKSTEYAQPGYYNSTLESGINVELTSTQRCGVHRYKFTQNQKNHIYIMSSYLIQKKAPRNSITTKCGQKCLQGQIYVNGGFGGRFGGYRIYYHLEWAIKRGDDSNEQYTVCMFNDTKVDPQASQVKGNYSGAIIQTTAREIEIFVGISYVSIKNAKQNLEKEVQGRSFDQVKEESLKVWKQEMSRFEISAISEDYQAKIDTAIYRTLLSPTLFSDFNGQYPSFSLNSTILTKPIDMKGVYTDMSLWDVHRTQFPWLLFQDEERFSDIAKSILLINRQGGYMPKWPFANGPTGCMIGAHANTILADWVLKQAYKDQNVDIEEILGFMLRNANQKTNWDGRPDPQSYAKLRYIAAQNNQHSSCSQTLELSYDDYGISQIANLLNKTSIEQDFLERSKFYKNVWNEKTKFFEPRMKNGTFVKISQEERINIFSNHYVQGDAWHYRFYAPHDPEGLIQLFGGYKDFLKELREFFQRSFFWNTKWLPNPYYWAGNQHDLLSVWLFSFANRPDLTQKYSRKILQNSYGIDGAGFPGNDDYGTMSAWLIWASLGLYPIPSLNTYIMGSPVVHSARIYRKMSGGKVLAFNVNVQNNSVKKHKVDSVVLNGKEVDRFVTHEELSVQNSLLNFSFYL